jgi:septum site-determining protein MinC
MLASSWRCPIVLDLSALSPDGSPHYQPPATGYLTEIISVLAQHGVNVLGLTAARRLPPTWEKEAEGLPFLGPGRHHASQSTHKNKLDLIDVIEFVAQRNKVTNLEDEACSSIESNSSPASYEMKANVNEKAKSDQEATEQRGNISPIDIPEYKDTTADFESVGANLSIPTTATSPTVYHGSVRSGQQITSEKGRSLLVLGSVSSGGEVMADCDIYVFGKLRGRALAGLGHGAMNDDHPMASPRIVATTFDPELVCIGEVFTTIDSVEDFGLTPNQSAVVTLEQGTLKFQAI